jgi:tetratricopeptide (TPR) repeat protein/RIO-like serine/threonine protein kinase
VDPHYDKLVGVQQIGRYQVLEEIARGGMGVVYEAHDPVVDRRVALKVLRGGSEVARKRFVREAKALARLRHAHVVQVHECAELANGSPYMVLEFVEGESLQDRLNRGGPLDVDDAVRTAATLAEAVQACHEAGVLHRDLKPDNVLVDRQGSLRLTDFGLARDTDPSLSRSQLSKDGQYLGTPGYWAPEQACGDLEEIGPATDVYGLGATLFALLTGRPPHTVEGLQDLLETLETPAPAPSSLRPGVPRWLDRVTAQCLRVETGQRYASAIALAEALRAGGDAPARNRATLWAAALCVVGVLVAGGIVASGPAARVETSPPPQASSPDSGTVSPAAEPPRSRDDLRMAEVLLDSGMAHMQAGQHAEAERVFSEAIVLNPELVGAIHNRGAMRYRLGDYEGAYADWERAIELEPNHAIAHSGRGTLRERAGDFAGAEADYSELIRIQPDLAKGYYKRGTVRWRLGNFEASVADLDEALRREPRDPKAWHNRGAAREELGDLEGAADDYREALRRSTHAQQTAQSQESLERVLTDLEASR